MTPKGASEQVRLVDIAQHYREPANAGSLLYEHFQITYEHMAASRIRGLRVDDVTWDTWERAASERGVTVSALIRDAVNTAIGAPVVALASELPPAQLQSRGVHKSRSGPCEHRNPPGVYCKRCD